MSQTPCPDQSRIESSVAARPRAFRRRGRSVDDVLHKERGTLELALILVVLGIMPLLYAVPAHWLILLNLYFLPVSLSGFYLGRYRAGVMSVFCVLSAMLVAFANLATNPHQSILINLIAVAVWGCVLGLTSMLIGTLSDERSRRYKEVCASHQTDTLSDPLTEIANRRAFERELRELLTDWNQHDVPFALVLVDIDHFKKFNDTYGHQAGDKVLHDVARSLETTIREADMVARYGGEEFVILLRNSSVEQAREISERARTEIEVSRYFHDRLKLRLTVSIGVAYVAKGDDTESLLQRADDALYTSKQAGRNCAHFHTGDTCVHFGAPLSRHQEVDRANQHAQPDITDDAYDDTVTGLPSRKVLIEELTRRVAEARRYQATLSLVLVQLDDFARFSQLSKAIETNVLSVLGEMTRCVMRDADLVVRYAPDQFAVLMPFTSQSDARRPAERLRTQVEACQSVKHQGSALPLSVSVGLAELSPGDDAASVLGRAMLALEDAIDRGGNCSILLCNGKPERIEIAAC